MNRTRPPFWLPASNYYVLAVAISMAFFFIVWALLDDVDIRSPWQTAGVSASILLIGAVVLRAMILRRANGPYVRQPSPPSPADRHKLTIDRAAAILGEIRRKSEAAIVLDRVASGHREVFEMCAAFMHRIDVELPTVQAGSPRLAALLKGRVKIADLHRFHTLRWAEIETRGLSASAQDLPDPTARERAAENAIAVVDQALAAYPAETSLLESRAVLGELAVSIQVANIVEDAEKAAADGDNRAARNLYCEALVLLGQDNIGSAGRERAARRIREEIDRLSFSDDNG